MSATFWERISYFAIAIAIAIAIAVAVLLFQAQLTSDEIGEISESQSGIERASSMVLELSVLSENTAQMQRLLGNPQYRGDPSKATEYAELTAQAHRRIDTLDALIPPDTTQRFHMARLAAALESLRNAAQNTGRSTAQSTTASSHLSSIDDAHQLAAALLSAAKDDLARRKSAEQAALRRVQIRTATVHISALVLCPFIVFYIIGEIAEQRRLTRSLVTANSDLGERLKQFADANEQLRTLARRMESSLEDERRRIAREVHDGLGSTLTALKLELAGAIETQSPKAGYQPRKRRASVDLVDSALETVQSVVTTLRPSIVDKLSLWEALDWKASQFSKQTGIACRTHFPPDLPVLSKPAAYDIFRIVEEALTNVARHADAEQVEVSATFVDGNVEIAVTDNGKGVQQEQLADRHSFGILSMQERARCRDCSLSISGTGQGTRLRLRCPTSENQDVKQA